MKSENSEHSYQYAGQPLTGAMVQELVLELFAGRLAERRDIVDKVIKTHIKRGGRKPRAADPDRMVKKALQGLKQRGLAENPSFGHWRIAKPDAVAPDLSPEGSSAPPEPDSDEAGSVEEQPAPKADVILGTGSGAVYIYYLPIYYQSAKKSGEPFWPCKIGKTERDPLARVIAQAATALPQYPHIAIILYTEYPAAWEDALHGVLTIRARRVEDAPGAEWFNTSPEEVLALVAVIDPSLAGDPAVA